MVDRSGGLQALGSALNGEQGLLMARRTSLFRATLNGERGRVT